MTRHHPWAVLSLAALILAATAAPAAADAPLKPNIVVILVDDMGFADIGCYGGEIATPNLDKLAAGGVRFSQFYNAARCCPTRAALLTGLYPHQAGVGHMTDERIGADGKAIPGYSGRLNDRCVTIAEALRPAGYFTAMSGKWHVGQNLGVTPWGRGFDRSLNAAAGGFFYHDSPRTDLFYNGQHVGRTGDPLPKAWYSSDLWTDFGLKFIDEAIEAKKPFYLHLCHNAPHFPLQADPQDIARWRGKFKAGWDALRLARHKRQIDMKLVDPQWPLAPRLPHVPAWEGLTPEQQDRYDHIMAIYAAVMERMDRAIGTLVEGLRQRGVLENTLILFMSDNGGNAEAGINGKLVGDNPGDAKSDVFVGECWATLNNTPFVRYKHYTDEGGIATPLIAHWPKGIATSRHGAIEPQPGHLIDIMATCLDVASATYPKEHNGKPITPAEGVSLRPAFEGKAIGRSTPLFWEHEGNRAIRDGNWKLVALENQPWRLYDLAADRTEQNDLAAKEPERAKAMAAKWNEWAARANVLPLGGWRGKAPAAGAGGGGGALSKKNRFDLKTGDRLARNEAPAIAGKGFTITARIDAKQPQGVIVAQGGAGQGYTLFVDKGQATFAMRIGGDLASVTAKTPLTGKHTIVANLDAAGMMSIAVDGQPPATRESSGPIKTLPTDGLDIGADRTGLVGPYGAENAFSGTIESVTIELERAKASN